MDPTLKHLHEIKGHYAVRIGVPVNLRGIVGGRELRQWLGTDRRVAERNAPAVVAAFYRQIDDAKIKLAASAPTIRTAAQSHYASELVADDRERRAAGSKAVAATNAWSAQHRAMLLRLLAADQLPADEAAALIGWAADDAISKGTASPMTDRRALLKGLAEAQLEAMARVEERDHGKISPPQPSRAILRDESDQSAGQVAAAPARRSKGAGPSLSTLLADFHQERTAGNRTLSDKTMAEHKVALRMLDEFLGKGTPAAAITKADMIAYKRALMVTPTNYRQRFPGKSLPEAIEANAKLREPFATLNPQTINEKWLSHVSTIMGWCANNGLLDDNPARGVKVDEGKGYREPTRVGFSKDDLARVFGHAIFADPRDYGTRQWALLIALHTGARSSSEIARIKLSDVYKEQDIWVFNLEEATKNAHSKRLVPVHQKLLDLGLLAYLEQLRKQGAIRLFSDWEPEDKINRWFLRTFKAEVGIVDARKVCRGYAQACTDRAKCRFERPDRGGVVEHVGFRSVRRLHATTHEGQPSEATILSTGLEPVRAGEAATCIWRGTGA